MKIQRQEMWKIPSSHCLSVAISAVISLIRIKKPSAVHSETKRRLDKLLGYTGTPFHIIEFHKFLPRILTEILRITFTILHKHGSVKLCLAHAYNIEI